MVYRSYSNTDMTEATKLVYLQKYDYTGQGISDSLFLNEQNYDRPKAGIKLVTPQPWGCDTIQ